VTLPLNRPGSLAFGPGKLCVSVNSNASPLVQVVRIDLERVEIVRKMRALRGRSPSVKQRQRVG
jgi:hypothetical protein